MPWLGAIDVIYFLFWTFLVYMIVALFMGLPIMTNVSQNHEVFLAPMVISLPLVIDREVDFVTAMLLSLQLVRQNLPVMLVWALLIAVLSLVALAPWFLGLIVVLPVLGHATWHLYRRAII